MWETKFREVHTNTEKEVIDKPKKKEKLELENVEEFGLKKYKMQDFVPYPFGWIPIYVFTSIGIIVAHLLGGYGYYITFSGQATAPWKNFVFCKRKFCKSSFKMTNKIIV